MQTRTSMESEPLALDSICQNRNKPSTELPAVRTGGFTWLETTHPKNFKTSTSLSTSAFNLFRLEAEGSMHRK